MLIRFVEVTDMGAYGKFIVARLDGVDLRTPSAMPDAYGAPLLNYAGRRRFNKHSTMVIDLQRGTGAAWPLDGGEFGMQNYLKEKLLGLEALVCPMYLPFVRWLHQDGRWAMGAGDLNEIPRYIELPIYYEGVTRSG